MHALPWREPRPGAHVARAALFYLLAQVEAGHGCPITMTYAAVPALRRAAGARRASGSRASLATRYDPRCMPGGAEARRLCGMAMTEKQGGSDVRANTTRADAPPADRRRVRAHRPQMVLLGADVRRLPRCSRRPTAGLVVLPACRAGCPTARATRFRIQRLKDKLGNRSNASSEIEFDGAWARLVGEEGRGVPTIIEMVNHTRLDCVHRRRRRACARRVAQATAPRRAPPRVRQRRSSTSR